MGVVSTEPLSFDHAITLAAGCTDYGGGYRGDDALFEAYQDGITLVAHVLRKAKEKWDSQASAVLAVGRDIEIDRLKALNAELVTALEKLARLGNGDQYGNSHGNTIAQQALAKNKGETE